MPQGVKHRRRAATHATLRAAFDRSLKVFIKRDAACVLGFAIANWAADGANTSCVDADACALRDVFDDGTGGGVDGIQTVATLNQHARTELARGCAHARHDGRGQGNFKG